MNPYVIAVRAPTSGIKEFEDGSWRVVSEHFNNDRLCVEQARQLMPYVITRGGGQVAVYEYDLASQRLKNKPLTIGRSALNKDFVLPKDHTEIADYEAAVAEKLNSNSNQYGAAHGDYAYGRLRDAKFAQAARKQSMAKTISDFAFATTERMLATCAIMTVIALSSAIVLNTAVRNGHDHVKAAMTPKSGVTLAESGMDERQVEALRNGAVEVVRPAPGRPYYTQVVRIYPTDYGQWVDVIEDMPMALYASGKYRAQKSAVPWRTPDQIPKAERVFRP